MKVSEFIEFLQGFDGDLEIIVKIDDETADVRGDVMTTEQGWAWSDRESVSFFPPGKLKEHYMRLREDRPEELRKISETAEADIANNDGWNNSIKIVFRNGRYY